MSQRPPLRVLKRTNGMTARELADRAGVHISTAMRWSARPREEFLAQAQEKKRRVKELRAKGMTMPAIAKETGYSIGTVHRYVHMSE